MADPGEASTAAFSLIPPGHPGVVSNCSRQGKFESDQHRQARSDFACCRERQSPVVLRFVVSASQIRHCTLIRKASLIRFRDFAES